MNTAQIHPHYFAGAGREPLFYKKLIRWAEREQGLSLKRQGLDAMLAAAQSGENGLLEAAQLHRLFPQEYHTAVQAAALLELEEGAVCAMTCALVEEQMHLRREGLTIAQVVDLLEAMVACIEQVLSLELDPEEEHTRRFLVHLRYLTRRVLTRTPELHEVEEPFYKTFTAQYPQAYACALEVARLLEESYDYPTGMDERLYILIHVAQLMREQEKRH